jgi:iron complex outermembrane receptor protein
MKRSTRILAALSSVALSPMAVAAHAQDVSQGSANDAASDGQDIVVTARLRAESAIAAPVAVTAFTSQAIEQAGINRPNDFISLSPNVSFTEAQDAGTSFLTIRGITQVRNGEPSVALVIDGVAQASPSVITQELFDIAQIEVLKGPQGALYGRNSIGGAIVITTKQPTNEYAGWVRLGVGNGGLMKAQGSISGPIVEDKLLFSVAGSLISDNGLLKNVYLNEKADPYRDRSLHGLLKWLPTDNLTIDLRAGYTRTTGGALNYVINSNPLFATLPDGADNTSVPITAAFRGKQERDLRDVSLKINLETDFGTLTSISAYSYDRNRSAGPAAPYDSTAAGGAQDGFTTNNNYSQELRFTSPSEKAFRYIVGAYYLHTDREYQITSAALNRTGIFYSGIDLSGPDQTTFASWNKERRDAYAVFGQAAIDLTSELELSAALRYDRDERRQTDILPIVPTTTDFINYTYPVNPNLGKSQSATFDEWQPKVTLAYKPSRNLTLYANYAKGFSSGGFNPVGLADAAATFGLVGLSDIYSPETSTTYEAGVKAALLGGKLRFDGSVFKTNFKNANFFSYFFQVNAQLISSIDTKLWGFEGEAKLELVPGLDLFAGYGYTHSRIEAYDIDPTVVGNKAPYVPSSSYNLGAQVNVPVSASWEVQARAEYTVKGKQYWEPYNITARSPVDLVNARLGLKNDDLDLTVTGWVRNLFNEKYNTEYVAGGFVQQARPRSFGVDVQMKF